MASITRRKDTIGTCWQAIIRRRGYPQQSKAFPTKTEAETWASLVEADMRRGIYQPGNMAERTTLSDLIKEFKTDFAPKHYRVREDAKEAWRFQLERLDESLGVYSLAAIDQKIVASFRDGRLKGAVGGRKPVNESTVRKELYMLSKVLGFAETEKGIALPRGNPVDKIRKPIEGKGRTRRLDAIEWAVFERECKKSRNPSLWPAVQLAVETAMRQGELLSLTWNHIDTKNRLALLTDPDKIKNMEPRAVPLSPAALDVLQAIPSKVGLLFSVERLTLYHAFGYACDRAKIKDFTFHDLRHEALSRLAERGDFTVLELAEVSGHKTLQMLKRYTHLRASKLADKLARPV